MYSRKLRGRLWIAMLTLLAVAAFGGCDEDSKKSAPTANFSDYYPLIKGVYREYQVSSPDADTYTFREMWTNGFEYGPQETVRSNTDAQWWLDEAYVDGQVLMYGAGGDGSPYAFPTALIKGIDNWEVGHTVFSFGHQNVKRFFFEFPMERAVTYVGLESVTVPAGTFEECMKVEFSFEDGEITGTSWYALGVGLVREEYDDGTLFELTEYGTSPDPAPMVLDCQPPIDYQNGGALLHINGSGFLDGAQVVIGRELAQSVEVLNTNTITAIVPYGYPGVVDVTVINPDLQVAALQDSFEYWEPSLAGEFNENIMGLDIVVRYPYAFIAARYDGLRIVDISDPENMSLIGFFKHSDLIGSETDAQRIAINGDVVYLHYGMGTVRMIDVSDLSAPTELGQYTNHYLHLDFFLDGTTGYMIGTGVSELEIIDLSVPEAPVVLGSYDGLGFVPSYITVSGDYAYIGGCTNPGVDCGFYVMNVADPANVTQVGFLPGPWGPITIDGDHAYIAADEEGMYILDISDPTTPTIVGHYQSNGTEYYYEPNHVLVRDGLAYVSNSSGIVEILDVSNPEEPRQLTRVMAGYNIQPMAWYASRIAIHDLHVYQAGAMLKVFNILE